MKGTGNKNAKKTLEHNRKRKDLVSNNLQQQKELPKVQNLDR